MARNAPKPMRTRKKLRLVVEKKMRTRKKLRLVIEKKMRTRKKVRLVIEKLKRQRSLKVRRKAGPSWRTWLAHQTSNRTVSKLKKKLTLKRKRKRKRQRKRRRKQLKRQSSPTLQQPRGKCTGGDQCGPVTDESDCTCDTDSDCTWDSVKHTHASTPDKSRGVQAPSTFNLVRYTWKGISHDAVTRTDDMVRRSRGAGGAQKMTILSLPTSTEQGRGQFIESGVVLNFSFDHAPGDPTAMCCKDEHDLHFILKPLEQDGRSVGFTMTMSDVPEMECVYQDTTATLAARM